MSNWISVAIALVVLLGSGVKAYSTFLSDVRVLQERVSHNITLAEETHAKVLELERSIIRIETEIQLDKYVWREDEAYASEGSI